MREELGLDLAARCALGVGTPPPSVARAFEVAIGDEAGPLLELLTARR